MATTTAAPKLTVPPVQTEPDAEPTPAHPDLHDRMTAAEQAIRQLAERADFGSDDGARQAVLDLVTYPA